MSDEKAEALVLPQPLFRGQRILLCVTGSIASYKAAELSRLLVKERADVSVVLSRSAAKFVGAATFSGITGNPVHTTMFAKSGGELHLELAKSADLIVVAPATADSLARFAQGQADDLISALLLCSHTPVLIAPAMHPQMWGHPATQRNVTTLIRDQKARLLGPVHGEVASGESGLGRMLEPEAILSEIKYALSEKDLAGRRLVITTGPTVEDLDPVRFLSNRSSGKMGFSIAQRAAWRGAEVTLISGPSQLSTPNRVRRIDVRSSEELGGELFRALGEDLTEADVLIMAAAVADYRPKTKQAVKVKRGDAPIALELEPNPDLLARVGALRSGQRPILAGFAVETGNDDEIEQAARAKLQKKKLDLIVANHGTDAFGRSDNRAQIISGTMIERLKRLDKGDLADRILDQIAKLFE